MSRSVVVAALVAFSASGLAAPARPHLLETSTLSFAPLGIPLQQATTVLQDQSVQPPSGWVEPPPAPPPPPSVDAPPMPQVRHEEAPSLGSVIGFMAAGALILTVGVVFNVYGIIVMALSPVCSATSYTQGCGTVLVGVGVVFLGIGIVLDAVGIPLLVVGNHKRNRRRAILDARNVSLDYSPSARAPQLTYAFSF